MVAHAKPGQSRAWTCSSAAGDREWNRWDNPSAIRSARGHTVNAALRRAADLEGMPAAIPLSQDGVLKTDWQGVRQTGSPRSLGDVDRVAAGLEIRGLRS